MRSEETRLRQVKRLTQVSQQKQIPGSKDSPDYQKSKNAWDHSHGNTFTILTIFNIHHSSHTEKQKQLAFSENKCTVGFPIRQLAQQIKMS